MKYYLYIIRLSNGYIFKIGIGSKDLKRIKTHDKQYGILVEDTLIVEGTKLQIKHLEGLLLNMFPRDGVPSEYDGLDGSTELRNNKYYDKCVDILRVNIDAMGIGFKTITRQELYKIKKHKQRKKRKVVKVKNDIIQSYNLSSAIYDFTIIQKRLLYHIVKLTQPFLKMDDINHKLDTPYIFNDHIEIVISDLVGKNYTNLQVVRDNINNLLQKEIIIDQKSYKIIDEVKFVKQSSIFSIKINIDFIEKILDFSKGYSKYGEDISGLPSIYSARLYELIPLGNYITYKIEKLKEMFGVSDKYKLNSDFIRIVVERSKKELDNKTFSFDYEIIKKGRSFHYIRLKGYRMNTKWKSF